ncbi:MAG: hypothetical protein ACOYK9_00110 [Chlamydiia bacterium]
MSTLSLGQMLSTPLGTDPGPYAEFIAIDTTEFEADNKEIQRFCPHEIYSSISNALDMQATVDTFFAGQAGISGERKHKCMFTIWTNYVFLAFPNDQNGEQMAIQCANLIKDCQLEKECNKFRNDVNTNPVYYQGITFQMKRKDLNDFFLKVIKLPSSVNWKKSDLIGIAPAEALYRQYKPII